MFSKWSELLNEEFFSDGLPISVASSFNFTGSRFTFSSLSSIIVVNKEVFWTSVKDLFKDVEEFSGKVAIFSGNVALAKLASLLRIWSEFLPSLLSCVTLVISCVLSGIRSIVFLYLFESVVSSIIKVPLTRLSFGLDTVTLGSFSFTYCFIGSPFRWYLLFVTSLDTFSKALFMLLDNCLLLFTFNAGVILLPIYLLFENLIFSFGEILKLLALLLLLPLRLAYKVLTFPLNDIFLLLLLLILLLLFKSLFLLLRNCSLLLVMLLILMFLLLMRLLLLLFGLFRLIFNTFLLLLLLLFILLLLLVAIALSCFFFRLMRVMLLTSWFNSLVLRLLIILFGDLSVQCGVLFL